MAVYYNQQTNEKVSASKVKNTYKKIDTSDGEAIITEGNYLVERLDGSKIGVHAEDFKLFYAKSKNKELDTATES